MNSTFVERVITFRLMDRHNFSHVIKVLTICKVYRILRSIDLQRIQLRNIRTFA